jgi:hypothetical protein
MNVITESIQKKPNAEILAILKVGGWHGGAAPTKHEFVR